VLIRVTWQPALGGVGVGTAWSGSAEVNVNLLLSPFHASTMSCCGTPAGNQGADGKNLPHSQYPPQSPINKQPGPQPGLGWQEKPYQPPTIPTPPPTHYSHGTSNSPPPSNFNNSYQQSVFNPSTQSGTTFQSPSIVRPPPSLPPSPPPVGSYGPVSVVSPPPPAIGYIIPTDEGKLSVSIDFGALVPNFLGYSLQPPDDFVS